MAFDPGKFGFAGVLRCRDVGLPLTPESGEKTRVFLRRWIYHSYPGLWSYHMETVISIVMLV